MDDAKAAPAAAAPAAAQKDSDETEGMSKAEYKKFQEQKAKAENVNMVRRPRLHDLNIMPLYLTPVTFSGSCRRSTRFLLKKWHAFGRRH